MPRSRRKKSPPRYTITLEIDGRTFEGTYTVEGRPPIVSLTSFYGSKATQLGRSPAEVIAKMLLSQLVPKSRAP